MKLLKAHLRQHWTDYPIVELGDARYYEAPIRPVSLLRYDGDKYLTVLVGGVIKEIKAGYIYTRPGRIEEVPRVSRTTLRRMMTISMRRWNRKHYHHRHGVWL